PVGAGRQAEARLAAPRRHHPRRHRLHGGEGLRVRPPLPRGDLPGAALRLRRDARAGGADLLHPLLLHDGAARDPRDHGPRGPGLDGGLAPPAPLHRHPPRAARARRPLLAPGGRDLDLPLAAPLPDPMSADAKDKHLGAGGYALVWIVLLALTGLSYWASTLGLAGWEAPVALAIAVVKATLVVWFFMHLLEA